MAIKTKNPRNLKKPRSLRISKKISLKEAISKVVNSVAKKILKNEPANNTLNDNPKDGNALSETLLDVPFAENGSITLVSKFFYSNDRFIETFDDNELYEALVQHYPDLHASQCNEALRRNAIIDLLNDSELMVNILENYNMTVLDFFKFLFRLSPSIFKGFFVKKILKTLKNKKYAKSIKFSSFSSRSSKKGLRKASSRCKAKRKRRIRR